MSRKRSIVLRDTTMKSFDAASKHLAALAHDRVPVREKPSAYHHGLIQAMMREGATLIYHIAELRRAWVEYGRSQSVPAHRRALLKLEEVVYALTRVVEDKPLSMPCDAALPSVTAGRRVYIAHEETDPCGARIAVYYDADTGRAIDPADLFKDPDTVLMYTGQVIKDN